MGTTQHGFAVRMQPWPRLLCGAERGAAVARRILVVDDNPAVGDDMRRILSPDRGPDRLDAMRRQMFGDEPPRNTEVVFEVDVSRQGREAVELATLARRMDRRYATAFVDMRMPPGWNGVETVARLWEVDPEIEVVIYTAYSDFRWDEVIAELGRSEGLHLLRKPLTPEQISRTAEVLTTKWLRHTRDHRA